MTKITEAQLIQSLKQMKEIKPRREWAVLLKSQILTEPSFAKATEGQAKTVVIMNVLSAMLFQKKLAYAFAAVLLLAVGTFGFVKFMPSGTVSQKSTASLTTQNSPVAQSEAEKKVVAAINVKIKDLAQVLRNNPAQNPQTIKTIVASLKTLSDVPGTDLSTNSDVRDVYQIVVGNQIAELQKATLTDEQKKALTEVEDLAKQGKYTEALEKILLINK